MDFIINTKEISENDKSRPGDQSTDIHSVDIKEKEDKNADET